MSREMQHFLPLLKKIARMRESRHRAYLKDCDKRLIQCFSECARNVLKSNVPLKKRQFNQLKRQKKNVRALAKKRTPIAEKRRIVRQCGGFLTSLLVPAIMALDSVLAGQLLPSLS